MLGALTCQLDSGGPELAGIEPGVTRTIIKNQSWNLTYTNILELLLLEKVHTCEDEKIIKTSTP